MGKQPEASALTAYSVSNFGGNGGFTLRGVSIEIEQAENGYIFKLQGSKKVEVKRKEEIFDNWERFDAIFVYESLDTGLAEVKGFFELIEKQLEKQVADKEKRNGKSKKK